MSAWSWGLIRLIKIWGLIKIWPRVIQQENLNQRKPPQLGTLSARAHGGSRDGAAACRSLDLPTWMLDRAACASMRMDTRPRVDVAALDALTTLLAQVAVTDAAPSNAPASHDENRGGHDAVPGFHIGRSQKNQAPNRNHI
jgi:hypothetical protein